MRIIVAQNGGFCAGVRHAVDTALSVDGRNTYVLGEIIHNRFVIESLAAHGVRQVESLDDVPSGANVIFSAHGVPLSFYDVCSSRGINVIDCTCGLVKRTQRIVKEQYDKGKAIVITGEKVHPEVIGLSGWCNNTAEVVDSENADLSALDGKEVCVVSQTTFSAVKFEAIVENIKKERKKTVEVFNTICYTTTGRQAETERIASVCEAVIVLGGMNSSNTNRLYDVAKKYCGHVFRLESAGDFDYSKLKNFSSVGIVSGASTPDAQTREVLFKMEEVSKEVQTTEAVEEEKAVSEAAVASAEENIDSEKAEKSVSTLEVAPTEQEESVEKVQSAEAETSEDPSPAETENAAEESEKAPETAEEPAGANTESSEAEAAAEESAESAESEKASPADTNPMDAVVAKIDNESRFKRGQIVTATISDATEDGLKILLPFSKSEVLLSKNELDCDEYAVSDYKNKIGDTINLLVVELKPSLKLSEKEMRRREEEDALIAEIETGKDFTVVCTGFNKGGLTSSLGSYQVFVPASEIRPGYVKDLEKYVGKTLRLRKLEGNKKDGRRKEIVASQRVILQEEKDARDAARAAKEEEFFSNIHVDDVVEGKVERVTNFGAFVSVNGFDCLAHISDLSWTNIKSVTDVLEIGKTYQFMVLKVDAENKKVSIGYKHLQPRPWDVVAEKYAVGDVVHGTVVRIISYGAFVEVEKGVDGLVHVSQVCNERIDTPASVLKVGDEIDAKIVALDVSARKMSLSIRALLPESEQKPPKTPKEGEREKPARKQRIPRKNDDDEIGNWSEGGSVSTSLADILANAEKNNKE